jgi:pilus assembly protein Flp/PilA
VVECGWPRATTQCVLPRLRAPAVLITSSFELEAHSMKKLVNGFHRNEEGAALAEYGLLVALIAVVCVVAVTALGTQISTAFSNIASALAGA